MRLLEVISRIRNDFKNEKLINIQDYKEIHYFLERKDREKFTKSLAVYKEGVCKYDIFTLTINKLSGNNIFIQLKDLGNDIERIYNATI